QAVKKAGDFLRANRRAIRFLSLFGLIFGVCYFFFATLTGVRLGLIRPYTFLLARMVSRTINLFGAGSAAQGSLVSSARFSIDISMGCDGVEASCLFFAGVLAFPTSWRAKAVGLAAGIPIVQVINFGRLVGLYYAGVYVPSLMDELHVYVAQTVVILLSTALLIVWLERIATKHQPGHRPGHRPA
ncbi:MAG TPA: exosortase H, partial [Blastocatellia bacterium]|nr:exosortase H [Blastocatellia bacterium]